MIWKPVGEELEVYLTYEQADFYTAEKARLVYETKLKKALPVVLQGFADAHFGKAIDMLKWWMLATPEDVGAVMKLPGISSITNIPSVTICQRLWRF